jgi:two-component system, OmpR family, sensor histidine kinase ChvG
MPDPVRERRVAPLSWSLGVSLTSRILAVNIIALALLAGSLFYLDSYRNRLLDGRFAQARDEAEIVAEALAMAVPVERRVLIGRIAAKQHIRLRIYGPDGDLAADSLALVPQSFILTDPDSEPWLIKAARVLDRTMDFILGAPPVAPYAEPAEDKAGAWPEAAAALTSGEATVHQRLAPDRTPVITAAVPIGKEGDVLVTARNDRDLTQDVRDARQSLAIVVGAALIISILLSLFLARTIVQPLRALVRAAVRVRLGRDREVVVPRLPERRDELGMLARATSDMSAALRHRIDAVETFAADVAHELKNPLASLRSAVDSLERVEDPELRRQLTGIAAHDVRRIDRLVTEIADASRIDAELSRTEFEPVDLVALVAAQVSAREQRGENGACNVTVKHAGGKGLLAAGDAPKLERVIDNLLDNAVSFSPPDGEIEVLLENAGARVTLRVCDQGPGIPADARQDIFERFHSVRPAAEDFGSHSGLGLAIARTIAEAHDGSLEAIDRPDGKPGACLSLELPAWEAD